MSLLRGAEYERFHRHTGKEPLTYYDMNLSAQDHQNFFTCDVDDGKQDYEGASVQIRPQSLASAT